MNNKLMTLNFVDLVSLINKILPVIPNLFGKSRPSGRDLAKQVRDDRFNCPEGPSRLYIVKVERSKQQRHPACSHVCIFAIIWLLQIKSAYAEILTTYSINSSTIKNLDAWIDQDTIVFIELDDVIVMPKSKMFHYNDNPYRHFIQNLINLSKQDSKYLALVAKWYQNRKLKLVEEGWRDFIKNLQGKNIPVYGLCTMPIHLQHIEQKRFSELKELGIGFTDKINGKEVLEIDKQEGWSSSFHNGIIFTGPFSKSQTLLNFMKITNISPKKILVFGKIKNDLQLVEKALRGFRISYYNILYLGAREVTGKPDPKVVQLQQKMLFEQGKWLEDEDL